MSNWWTLGESTNNEATEQETVYDNAKRRKILYSKISNRQKEGLIKKFHLEKMLMSKNPNSQGLVLRLYDDGNLESTPLDKEALNAIKRERRVKNTKTKAFSPPPWVTYIALTAPPKCDLGHYFKQHKVLNHLINKQSYWKNKFDNTSHLPNLPNGNNCVRSLSPQKLIKKSQNSLIEVNTADYKIMYPRSRHVVPFSNVREQLKIKTNMKNWVDSDLNMFSEKSPEIRQNYELCRKLLCKMEKQKLEHHNKSKNFEKAKSTKSPDRYLEGFNLDYASNQTFKINEANSCSNIIWDEGCTKDILSNQTRAIRRKILEDLVTEKEIDSMRVKIQSQLKSRLL